MPYLLIQTNQTLSQEQSRALLAAASKSVANLLGKPEGYVMVAIQPNTSMLFAGNDQPLAYLQLKSLGLPESSTTEFSHVLCNLINSELDIATDRIYIEFIAPERHMWGWKNKTF